MLPGLRDPRARWLRSITSTWRTVWPWRRYRSLGADKLGITLNLTNALPNTPSDPADVEAARRIDALFNRMYPRAHPAVAVPGGPACTMCGIFGLAEIIRADDLEVIGGG
jgi:beta-glucosidase